MWVDERGWVGEDTFAALSFLCPPPFLNARVRCRRGFDSATLNTGAQFTVWGAPGGEGGLQEALLRCQEWFLGSLKVDEEDFGNEEEEQAKSAKH